VSLSNWAHGFIGIIPTTTTRDAKNKMAAILYKCVVFS
jgi:hypothetical protein